MRNAPLLKHDRRFKATAVAAPRQIHLLVSWQQCRCASAQMLHPDRAIWGHFTVACREPGCRSVWYDPPHEPGPEA